MTSGGAVAALPPIFKVCTGEAGYTDQKFPEFEAEAPAHAFALPFTITKFAGLAQWKIHKETQAAVTKRGSSYKNDTFKLNTRLVFSINDVLALARTNTMFVGVTKPIKDKLINMEDVATKWDKVSYVFSADIGSHFIGGTPTRASMIRRQIMGESVVYCFDAAIISDDAQRTSTMTALKTYLPSAINAVTLKYIVPEIYGCKVTKGSVLYVPAGWTIIDAAESGPLNWGGSASPCSWTYMSANGPDL